VEIDTDMDDVDRIFQYLVNHLSTNAPRYLERPFQISELYQRLIPYRYHRDVLRFDTIEDYEIAVLRLLAGERGYVHVEPEDVQRALADEAALPNPTPGAFREYAAATMTLSPDAVRRFRTTEEAYAPPVLSKPTAPYEPPAAVAAPAPSSNVVPPTPPPVREPARPTDPTIHDLTAAASSYDMPFESIERAAGCPGCGETLPRDRDVRFCPHCGLRIAIVPCRHCGETLEPEWRFCSACGRRFDD
jgi:hypothetical protein